MKRDKSHYAFEQAAKVLVGGVNSPVRSFAAVGGGPVFIASARGATLTDVDGNQYVDYVGTWGPAIVGHAQPEVTDAICAAARNGASFGAPCEAETRLARRVTELMPAIEKVRFTSSGTEAAMTALRLARGHTGRAKVVKFAGCYHGHSDALLVSAGSGATTLGMPSSKGVTGAAVGDTLVAGFNDLAGLTSVFEELGEEIAAVIVEPVAGNMGVVPPAEGFLPGLRRLCDRYASVLIFDEVMTGFRVGAGGAQGLYGVRPDLTVLGKIIGGGMPVGAVGGPASIMDKLAPLGPVYQAGTLSGNPVAMAAGLATLNLLGRPGFYERLEETSAALEAGLRSAAGEAGMAGRTCINRVGSMLTLFFTPGPVTDYASATASDTKAFGRFFQAMLDEGIYLPPSQFESWFVSAAHGRDEIDKTIAAAGVALRAARAEE